MGISPIHSIDGVMVEASARKHSDARWKAMARQTGDELTLGIRVSIQAG
jgi:hypothetical protein